MRMGGANEQLGNVSLLHPPKNRFTRQQGATASWQCANAPWQGAPPPRQGAQMSHRQQGAIAPWQGANAPW